jgi:hypothetical protein
METAGMPDTVQRAVSIVIVVLGIGLVAGLNALVLLAAQRSPLDRTRRMLLVGLAGAFLASWLGTAMRVGAGPTVQPRSNELGLPFNLLIGFGPMFVAIAVLLASRTARAVNAAIPPTWLVRAQTYRVVGLIFLYPYLYYGMLPAEFALPAGAGDFLTGALAPFVANAIAQRRRHALAWAIAWNVFGILDLIVAPVAAVLSGAMLITAYPLSLVPLFIGPPVGILTHVYSLHNLARGSFLSAVTTGSSGTGTSRAGTVRGRLQAT